MAKQLSSGVAAIMILAVIIAIAVLGASTITGAQIAQPPTPTQVSICLDGCGSGQVACLQNGGTIDACKAAFKACRDACSKS